MWNALLFDFHPVTLGAVFLVFTLWMLVQRKQRAALIFAVLAMMCKEQIGLSVALLGVYAIFFVKHPVRRAPAARAGRERNEAESKDASRLARFFQSRDWRFGLLLIVIGVVWSVIALGVIIPAFQPSGSSYYLNRYGRLGSTFAEVLLSPLTKPDVFWSMISGPKRVAYYGDLLLPLGFLPILGIEMLLPALPDIALNTLSAFAPSRTLDYHYAVIAVPFLVLATAWGIDRLIALAGWPQDATGKAQCDDRGQRLRAGGDGGLSDRSVSRVRAAVRSVCGHLHDRAARSDRLAAGRADSA